MGIIGAILGWALLGLIAGALARLLMPGRQPMTIFMTIVLGIVGSLVGGMISWLFRGGVTPYHPSGWIMATVGAVLVLWAYVAYARRHPGGI